MLLKAGDCNCLKICGRGIGVPKAAIMATLGFRLMNFDLRKIDKVS